MIVVQNATLNQFVADIKKLYPTAKVLAPNSSELELKGRHYFYSKIKYSEFDIVVIPQSVLTMIPDSKALQDDYINEKIQEKLKSLELLQEQRQETENNSEKMFLQSTINSIEKEIEQLQNGNITGQSKKKKQKDVEKDKESTKAKAEKQLDRKTDENLLTFDDLGIDALLVDEAHNYKHLGFESTIQKVKGIDKSSSKQAISLLLKIRSVRARTGNNNIVFATGTPISNTAAEIWTFMKYLLPDDILEQYGIKHFDDFVHNFGKIATNLEYKTNGQYKEVTRFSGYVSIPELIQVWSLCTDTVLTSDEQLKKVNEKRPDKETGKDIDIFLDPTPSFISIMDTIKRELKAYDEMPGMEKKKNRHIPITMYGLAKRAAIDPRLVSENAIDEPNSKTNKAVEEIIRDLAKTSSYNGTCAVFCDQYQNKVTGFNIFEDIKKKLIERGVPEDQIFIMKSGMKPNQKQQIFDKVNKGEIRVVLGTTALLGTGVNMQEKLYLLIHLDAPVRPMDYEQRNGRIIRQGNLHKQMNIPVRVLRFGVKNSLDITAYQTLKIKQTFIQSIMNGKEFLKNNLENRELEEEAETDFDNPVAQLSGSQYALILQQAIREYNKLLAKEKDYIANQSYAETNIPKNNTLIEHYKKLQNKEQERLNTVSALFKDGEISNVKIKVDNWNNKKDTLSDFAFSPNNKEQFAKATKNINKIVDITSEKLRERSKYNGEDKTTITFRTSIENADKTDSIGVVIKCNLESTLTYINNNFSYTVSRNYTCDIPALDIEDLNLGSGYA
ncbi:MAG: hypothetical protein HUJ68_01040, partial [Clostridia bacterium]|nr:hypothetical protein [Clostridia bacterium]